MNITIIEKDTIQGGFDVEVVDKFDVFKIHSSDILYVNYYNHAVWFHLENQKFHTYILMFEDIEGRILKYRNFILSYRHLIINMDKISHIDKKYFVLNNGYRLHINKKRFDEIKTAYTDYLFTKFEK